MTTMDTCPHCGSAACVVRETTSTCLGFMPFIDDQGRRHEHNPNKVTELRTCSACNKPYRVKITQSCWCGWKNANG